MRPARAAWPAQAVGLAALGLLAACGLVTAGIEERWLADAQVVQGRVEVAFKAPLEPRRRLELCLVLPADQGPLTAALAAGGPGAAPPRATLLGPRGRVELPTLRFLTDRKRTLACFGEPPGAPAPSGRRFTGVLLESARPLRLDGVVARDAEAR